MLSVSTGGQPIQNVNPEYQGIWEEVDAELRSRHIENPIVYSDLWDWYGRWSSGDLPTYQSRRSFLSELFTPLINYIQNRSAGPPPEPTGWARVDRVIGEIRSRLSRAENEEHFQAIGLLCREAIISLAQEVYSPDKHPSLNGIDLSQTDAKRMLAAYISTELRNGANQETRKYAHAAVDLAVALQHRRTANFRDAAMCLEATTAVVNIIAITSGRRDP